MARLIDGKNWAPRPDKAAKPIQRVWPPPERKERSLGHWRDLPAIVDIRKMIDPRGKGA